MKEFFLNLPQAMYDPARVYTAMAAIILCAVIGMITGPMHGNTNPFLWKLVNGLFGKVGARLDRTQRRAGDLMFRGFFLLVVALVVVSALAEGAVKLAAGYPYKGLAYVVLLSLSMTVGTVWFALLRLFFARRDNKVGKAAFSSIAVSSRIDLSQTDLYGVTRTGMALAARAFDKGVVGPVFWYLLAGLSGAYIYAGLAAFSARFGKDGFTKGFGAVPLALEKLVGFAPGALWYVGIAWCGVVGLVASFAAPFLASVTLGVCIILGFGMTGYAWRRRSRAVPRTDSAGGVTSEAERSGVLDVPRQRSPRGPASGPRRDLS